MAITLNKIDELKKLIQYTVKETLKIRIFVENTQQAISGDLEAFSLEDSLRKVIESQNNIQRNIESVNKDFRQLQGYLKSDSSRRRDMLRAYKLSKPIKQAAVNMANYLKIYLSKKHVIDKPLSIPTNSLTVDRMIEILREQQKSSALRALENLEFGGAANCTIITATWIFGISVQIQVVDSRVIQYHFFLRNYSKVLDSLIKILEERWSMSFKFEEQSPVKFIVKFTHLVDRHKQIFTDKCAVCGFHLNFKSGIPMLPIFYSKAKLYHVECYLD